MFFRQWDILLVDDEPDVLQISKLAMKSFKVYGVPLKLHTTASKAETIGYLNSEPGGKRRNPTLRICAMPSGATISSI